MARRFRFSLQKVLDLRLWEEQQAETRLAAKTSQCHLCQRAIEDLLARRREVFVGRRSGALDLTWLAAQDRFRQRLGREIEVKEQELAKLTVEREDLLAVYVQARRRREVFSQLEERQSQLFDQAEAKRDALAQDDLNTAAYIRKMRLLEGSIG